MSQLKHTILIAEDEPMLRKLLRRTLEKDGYDVLVAENGQEALDIAKEHEADIDMLVSDIQMPGMTGIELATELNRLLPKLPVLLVSGFSHGMLRLDAGWSYLENPFTPARCCKKFTRVCRMRRTSMQCKSA